MLDETLHRRWHPHAALEFQMRVGDREEARGRKRVCPRGRAGLVTRPCTQLRPPQLPPDHRPDVSKS